MAIENNVRVDTTFIGYFLIGFVFLIFGVMGLQDGGLFGEFTPENYRNLPIDYSVFSMVVGAVGFIMILLAVFAYRTGKQITAVSFLFFGLFFIFVRFNHVAKSGLGQLTANSDWFLLVAFAIFFLIIAIYAFVAEAPKFVTVLILLTALTAFFFGLCCLYAPFGMDNVDLHKAMGFVFGIFALLAFVIATYLGLAYAVPKKIPLI